MILTYDANKNPTSVIAQFWDGSTWLNSMQFKFGYDADNFMQFTVFKVWDFDGIAIMLGDSTYAYYHTVVTGIPGLRSENFAVYPNPSKGKFTISGSANSNAIEIYDLQGKRIYSDYNSNLQKSKELDLSGYNKGVYILKIYNGTKSYNRKIILQ